MDTFLKADLSSYQPCRPTMNGRDNAISSALSWHKAKCHMKAQETATVLKLTGSGSQPGQDIGADEAAFHRTTGLGQHRLL